MDPTLVAEAPPTVQVIPSPGERPVTSLSQSTPMNPDSTATAAALSAFPNFAQTGIAPEINVTLPPQPPVVEAAVPLFSTQPSVEIGYNGPLGSLEPVGGGGTLIPEVVLPSDTSNDMAAAATEVGNAPATSTTELTMASPQITESGFGTTTVESTLPPTGVLSPITFTDTAVSGPELSLPSSSDLPGAGEASMSEITTPAFNTPVNVVKPPAEVEVDPGSSVAEPNTVKIDDLQPKLDTTVDGRADTGNNSVDIASVRPPGSTAQIQADGSITWDTKILSPDVALVAVGLEETSLTQDRWEEALALREKEITDAHSSTLEEKLKPVQKVREFLRGNPDAVGELVRVIDAASKDTTGFQKDTGSTNTDSEQTI